MIDCIIILTNKKDEVLNTLYLDNEFMREIIIDEMKKQEVPNIYVKEQDIDNIVPTLWELQEDKTYLEITC